MSTTSIAKGGEADALAATARLIGRALCCPGRTRRLAVSREQRRNSRLLRAGLRSARRGLQGRTYSVEQLDAAYRVAAEILPTGIDAWNNI